MEHLKIPSENQPIEGIKTTSTKAKALLLLAHGAGAGMNHSFIESLANHLSDLQTGVIPI